MNKGYEKVKHILVQRSKESHLQCISDYYNDPLMCKNCNTVIPYKKRHTSKFCNQSCAAKYNNTHRRKFIKCITCGNFFKDNRSKKFCSSACCATNKSEERIKLWLTGELSGMYGDSIAPYVKRYLIQTRGEKCEKCGWSEINLYSKRIPLTINHIDGNYKNTVPYNLELLCPNCHSLTSTYGSLNRGNGRSLRRVRRKAKLV